MPNGLWSASGGSFSCTVHIYSGLVQRVVRLSSSVGICSLFSRVYSYGTYL